MLAAVAVHLIAEGFLVHLIAAGSTAAEVCYTAFAITRRGEAWCARRAAGTVKVALTERLAGAVELWDDLHSASGPCVHEFDGVNALVSYSRCRPTGGVARSWWV